MSATFGPFQINNFTGSRTTPAVAVPQGATSCAIDFTGLTNPAITVETDVEWSPDGVTWQLAGAATFVTGGHTHDGTPITDFTVTTDIPQGGTTPKLRGTLTVTGGSISATVTIKTTP